MFPESQANHGADPLIRLRNGLEHLQKSNSQDGATDSYKMGQDTPIPPSLTPRTQAESMPARVLEIF